MSYNDEPSNYLLYDLAGFAPINLHGSSNLYLWHRFFGLPISGLKVHTAAGTCAFMKTMYMYNTVEYKESLNFL